MRNLHRSDVWLMAICLLAGCTAAPQEEPRLPTSPAMGVVKIDGQPGDFVEVTCHPEPGTSEIKYPLTAMTDSNGVFNLSTYESKDGLPAGTYTLAFKWPEQTLMPKDKLKGKYANPAKSGHKITITGDKAVKVDLGTIELTSKK